MNSIRPHGRTTVIITTYNDELATLEKAVASALEQSLLPAAVLVVDDGSNNSVAQQVVDKFLAESEVTLRCLKKAQWWAFLCQKLWPRKYHQRVCHLS